MRVSSYVFSDDLGEGPFSFEIFFTADVCVFGNVFSITDIKCVGTAGEGLEYDQLPEIDQNKIKNTIQRRVDEWRENGEAHDWVSKVRDHWEPEFDLD